MSTKRREGCATTPRIRISPQFWTSDEHEVTRGLRPTTCKLRISPQFWTSDEHEVTRGLRGDVQNLHFTTVLDVRRARSDERVVSRLGQPNPPCVKKERNFKEVLIHSHSQQIFSAQSFSADLLSRYSQQIFSADLLSRSSQQILSRSSQQIFSAQPFSADLLSRAILSRSSQPFSACCCGQGLVVSYCLIICCGQGLVVRYCLISYCLIICCGQGLVVSYCLIICCGQGLVVSYCLISYCVIICCGQGLVVSYCLIMLVVNTARVL